jgi:replicative DNA helicase
VNIPEVLLDALTEAELAAEVACLGAALLSIDARAGLVAMLVPDDFSREAHASLFAVLASMHQESEHIDHVTVMDRLADLGKLDHIGGPVALHDLSDRSATPSPAAWPVYASIVKREATRRDARRLLCQAVTHLDARDDPTVVAAALTSSLHRLFGTFT